MSALTDYHIYIVMLPTIGISRTPDGPANSEKSIPYNNRFYKKKPSHI